MNSNITKLISSAAILCAVCSCNGGKKAADVQQPAAQPAETVRLVETVSASKMPVVHNQTYPTTVQAKAVNNIAPQMSSRIQKILVDVGSFVSAGQVLAEMDKVQLNQAELKLSNDSKELERLRGLYEQGGISQSDFEAVELAYKVSKSSYDNLLENTVLRSPISGVVTARNYDRGDMYSMAQPIFVVQQITPVKLLVGISEGDYSKVKTGQKVSITADAIPGKTFTGKINKIYPTVDAASHTFNVEVIVDNTGRELRPGMYAKVDVTFDTVSNIVVPDQAIVKQQGSGQKSVFVVGPESTVISKVVELGRHFDSSYEILSGIEEGEIVVVKGHTGLFNGSKVSVKGE